MRESWLLNMDPDCLSSLLRQNGSPLLVGSKAIVREQLRRLRNAIPSVYWYFAAKANSDVELLRTLAMDGCAFDIASHSELQRVQSALHDLGLNDFQTSGLENDPRPTKASYEKACIEKASSGNFLPSIVHSHPCKSPTDIAACYRDGLRWFVFDCESELEKLAIAAPQARLLLRIKLDDRSGAVRFSERFGVSQESLLALAASARKLGIPIEGITFHVGSQAIDPADFDVALRSARQAWDSLEANEFNLSVLDIGGGFPVVYRDQKAPSIEDYGRSVAASLDRHFGDLHVADRAPTIIAEPGRILCAPAVSLLTTVIGKQHRDGKPWYTIDDGRYGSFSGKYFSATTFDFYPLRIENTSVKQSMIAGPSCDGGDIVAIDYPVPDLEVGDLLVVPMMGAYAAVGATDFNGLPRAKQIWID